MLRRTTKFRLLLALVLFLMRAEPRAWAQAPDLDKVLDQTSRQVTAFLDEVSDVKCTEEVTQTKLSPSGKPQYTERGTYDYLILLSGGNDELQLNESRLAVAEPRKTRNMPMLISNGFSMLFLIFHPFYRSSFHFELEGEDVLDGQKLLRIGFQHHPGSRTPAALAVRGREYPLDLAGTAWIDLATGAIARIDATVGRDMQDVGMKKFSASVEYAPIRLPGWKQAYRFPVLATVDVESLRQHWRNEHRFTAYKRFMVDTQEAVSSNLGKESTQK